MKHKFTLLVAVLLAFSGLALDSLAQTSTQYAKLDTLLTALEKHDKFMGSVCISRDGKVEYAKAFGFRDIDNKIPATTATTYSIGSVTKMFTSVMVMQLTEEGKLSLEDNLSRWFPQLPNAGNITIDEMLTHRSGIWSVTDDSLYMDWNTEVVTQAEMLERILTHDPEFSPGEKSAYSNSNFILLGYIIEKVTGKSYAQCLEERINKRIGLTATTFGHGSDKNNAAKSYQITGTGWEEVTATDPSVPHGAGAIESTPTELVKFANALFGNKLMSESSLKKMITPEGEYGRGIFSAPFYELTGFGHTGGIDGFRSVLFHFADGDITAAICSNALNYKQNDILMAMLSAATNREFLVPDFKVAAVDPSGFNAFEGTYSSPDFPLKITIKLEGNTLTAQATGQGSFPLEAVSETEFIFQQAGIRLIFNGAAGTFNLKQGSVDVIMTRE